MNQKTPDEQPPDLSAIWQALTPLSIPPSLGMVPGLEIWLANLVPLKPLVHLIAAWLDADDRADVARLRQPDDQIRMLVRRGLRRLLLARRLQCTPEQLRFARGPWSKPMLCEPAGTLHFNTASTADWFLCGMARDTELGVDIESLTRFTWSADVAAVVCSTQERQQLAGLRKRNGRRPFCVYGRPRRRY